MFGISGMKFENPWNIASIYELQYFNCPRCFYKHHSKQAFVEHAYKIHPEALFSLQAIQDGSLSDIDVPWDTMEFPGLEDSKAKLDLDSDGNEVLPDLDDAGADLDHDVEPLLKQEPGTMDTSFPLGVGEKDVKVEIESDDNELNEDGTEKKKRKKKHKCGTCGKVFRGSYELKRDGLSLCYDISKFYAAVFRFCIDFIFKWSNVTFLMALKIFIISFF